MRGYRVCIMRRTAACRAAHMHPAQITAVRHLNVIAGSRNRVHAHIYGAHTANVVERQSLRGTDSEMMVVEIRVTRIRWTNWAGRVGGAGYLALSVATADQGSVLDGNAVFK